MILDRELNLLVVSMVMHLSRINWKKRSAAKRRGKEVDLVGPEIPLDLQTEILSRLPAKSLMRFKCVSKLWSCLIHSRYLSNLHLTVASRSREHRLYMSLVNHLSCDSMEVCHNPGKSLLLSLSSSGHTNSVESLDQDLTMEGIGGHNMVVLRGLILYTVCRKACIYNPATRQSLTLPAVKSKLFAEEECDDDKNVYYLLGHDPVLDQYKVVCIVVTFPEDYSDTMLSEYWVFVLEAGGSWKKNESDQPPHFPTRQGLCINGVIYYLANTCMSMDVVICFDVRSEEFNMIQGPHLETVGCVGYIEYGGKPTIIDHTNLGQNGLVDLWVLDGGKWSKKSQVLQSSQMHLLNDENISILVVNCTTQNGEIVFLPNLKHYPRYFLYYDIQKNDLRKVNVSGEGAHKSFGENYVYVKHMDKCETIIHLEI